MDEVINDFPPNWEDLVKAFPQAAKNRVVLVTVDQKIYNPFNLPMREDLLVHERVHIRQQKAFEGTWQDWSNYYIHDPNFRFLVEMEAYGIQCGYIKKHVGKLQYKQALKHYAKVLSGPTYADEKGHTICSYEYALSNIKAWAEK